MGGGKREEWGKMIRGRYREFRVGGRKEERRRKRTVSLGRFDAEARVARLAAGFEVVFLGVEVVLGGV